MYAAQRGDDVVDIAKLNVVVGADTDGAEKGFDRVSSRISSFGTIATTALLGAGALIVGAGGAAVAAASGFEATMSGVKAVSGATQTEMKGLSGLALQLGKDTAFSASEAAAGIEELIKGGLSIDDVMSGAAKSTLNLAAAGGVSLPDAAIIAANALAQFGLKGADMAHVADLIAGAANASALDVGQFKYSLQMAGAVASTVGFSFDDLAQAIAVMGKAGITGSDAGTSLKTMMLNLTPQTAKAHDLMEKLGIITKEGGNQFFDASGKVKSMAEVAQILQNATKNLTDEQKLSTLAQLFGTDAVRAGAIMAKEGAAGFRAMATDMGKVTAESVGLEKLNNLAGDIKTLGGSVETAAITFGTVFLPVLRDATKWATEFVNSLIPWIETVGPTVVSTIQTLGTLFGDLVKTGDLTAFAKGLEDSFGIDLTPLVAAIETVRDVIAAIAKGFNEGGLAGAFTAWLTEAGKFGGKVLTWIGDQVNPILTKLGAWGEAFVDWIGPKVGPMLTEAGKLAVKLWTWITDVAAPAILGKLGEWGAAFVAWVAPMVAPMVTAAGAILTALGTWIVDTAAPAVLKKLGEWGKQFTDWIGPATTDFLKAWPGHLTRFLDWIEFTAAPAIYKTRASWVATFTDWIGGADGTGEGTAAGGLFATIGNIAGVIFEFIGKTAEVLGPRLLSWAGKFLGWIVTDVVPFLAVELGKMLVTIGTWLVTDAIPWAAEHLKEFGAAIVRGIIAGILAAPGAIGDALKSLIPPGLPGGSPITVTPTPTPSPVPVIRPATPRPGQTVAAGPNFQGKYLYTWNGGANSEWRDQGGRGYPGHSYMSGVPGEAFLPDRPGQFVLPGGGGSGPITVPVYIGGDLIATVVAKANQRYANRGGR